MSTIESLIKAIASASASPIINAAQRNRTVIEIKKKLGIYSPQPPEKFDDVYAHALVEYGVEIKNDFDKTQLELNLKFFDNQEVRKIFYQTFSSGQTLDFNYQEWTPLRDEAQKDRIDVLQVEKFYQAFVNVAKRSINPGQHITHRLLQQLLNKSTEPLQQLLPDEFKALIEEKTKAFCGRVFVFNEFENFLKKHPKGYFTVIGDAGMGKSAIAAKYVSEYKAICYFNILAENRNTPEKFLQSIKQQLINRYQLQNAENDNLSSLLTKVNQKFATGERLVIVVDALDEVQETSKGVNLLDLPNHLPEGIYFMLTRRPYASNQKYLLTEGVGYQELNLTDEQYESSNQSDVKEYIRYCIKDHPELKEGLQQWIKSNKLQEEEFTGELVVKSENNFMYLRYILQDIAIPEGNYKDKTIDKLPKGLKEYYDQHWLRMKMDKAPQTLMVIVLFIIVQIPTSPTIQMIADIAKEVIPKYRSPQKRVGI
ncbi:MAG: ATP-binding protein [Desmonostoc geniculatum HA4340-LM1]|jgi:hypothetical protein|nr:ATP-binding protein [Desmonostoc geniculatum HA4340-LM1]